MRRRMRGILYHRIILTTMAILLIVMSCPVAPKVSAASASENDNVMLFQDDFEGNNSTAWTAPNGNWSIESGQSGELFSDDFENGSASEWGRNSGTWSIVTDGNSSAYRQSSGDGASELLAGDNSWGDYSFEADVKLLTGEGAMMDFRYQDNQHFYYLYMSENYIRLMKQNGSQQEWLQAYDGPSLVKDQFVRIKVEASGSTFNIYRNGTLLFNVTDDNNDYTYGKIGLATWASTVEFDNVSVMDTSDNNIYSQNDPNGGEAYAGDSAWTNYALQTQIRLSSIDQTGTVGIALRQQDDGSRYSMQYTANDAHAGNVKIVKIADDMTTTLAEVPYSMTIGKPYTWKGVAAGKFLELYINDVKLLTAEDNSLPTGKIALLTAQATASFDDVIVDSITAPVVSDGNTAYYVSASTGDDTNDGQSEATAWRTLNKVNASTFLPGDSILLKAGDRWNEPLLLKQSGTEDHPIQVASYGTGDKPVIAWNAPNGGGVVTGKNLSNWIIKDLAVEVIPSSTQSWNNITAGILINYDNSRLHRNVRIDGNEVYSSTFNSNTNGIVISSLVPGTDYREVARDIVISNNTVHDIGWYGITTTGWDIVKNEELRSQLLYGNVRVTGNKVYNMASQGIVVQNAHDSSIDRNVVHDGGLGTDTWGPGGLWFIASRDSIIKFNEIYNMSDANSGFDGAGLNIDWYCDNITVQYNYSHDNKGNGITTMSNIGAKIINNKVKGNKAEQSNGSGQIALGNFTGRPDLSTGLHNVEVAHNMIIVDVDNTAAINSAANPYGTWSGNTIHSNHIVLTQGTQEAAAIDVGVDTHIDSINNNLIYSELATFRSTFKGTTYRSLVDWQDGTGYDRSTQVLTLPQNSFLPSQVQNIHAAFDEGIVQLSWAALDEQVTPITAISGKIAHYNIYRSTTATFTPAYANMIGESDTAAFMDHEELQPNTTYYYKVEAEGIDGNNGATSEAVQVTTGSVVSENENPKVVDFFSLRDGYKLNLANLPVTPYISGIPNIAKVLLYVDDQLVQEMTTPPYSYTVTGLSNGEHRLQYRVHDTSGMVTASKEIKIDKQITALRSLFTETKPSINGSLEEWHRPDFILNQLSQVKNILPGFRDSWTKDKLTASGYTQWDNNNLYLAIEVTEDSHHLSITNPADLWKGSSIQIAIDPDRGSVPGKKGYTELAFGLTENGDMLGYRYNAISGRTAGIFTAGEVVITRDEASNRTVYEMAIPWHEILPADVTIKDGSALGISILANYSDGSYSHPDYGDARNGWIEYNSGIGAGKAPEQFGYLILDKQAFATPVISGTADQQKIEVSWPAVTGATGYIIQYGTKSGTYSNVIHVGTATKYTINGPTQGATYYITAIAYDSYGESKPSNEIAIVIPRNSGNTGNENNGQSGSGAASSTNPGASSSSHDVAASSLLKLQDHTVYAEIAANQTTVSLPLADIEAFGNYPLQIKQGSVSLLIKKTVLEALKAQAGNTIGSSVQITLAPVKDTAIHGDVKNNGNAVIKSVGRAYELDITLHTTDKQKFNAGKVNGQVILSLPYDAKEVDPDLLGIYFYNNNSKQWEHAGGIVDQTAGKINLAMEELGMYTVLEYKKTFTDVPSEHWASRTLQILAAKHIIQGTTDVTFQPSNKTTRAEFITMLSKVLKLPTETSAQTTFNDVTSNAWYAEDVAASVKAGIVTGRNDHIFAPEETITRAEMAVLIVRSLGIDVQNYATTSSYADAKNIPIWALPYVTDATDANLIQGRGQEIFAPQQPALRAESAQLIFNLLQQQDIIETKLIRN
ncbi:hypothetical protein BVG16_29010 [Paenibacillus selenitireducens]|uniref:S-layer protein n=1 Tax=Paenibacillus selenitireducens TaxID=1324314 RepID=A0A1T2X0Q2_9BACL|nr:S-layer homology domain-containing protein [Paenibacillus selenitireducens]OPA73375.1 hypothetical protein BVG16_29010 [Paenibacillus selenitireducens]